jgi:capsule polysaccharide export protein KpsE/RkpR
MSEYRGLDFLDYVIIIVKHKFQLIFMTIIVLVLSYLLIRFGIQEKFDSEALIISSESGQAGGLGSLLSSFSDLPIDIPGISASGGSTEMFTTIIYSNSNLKKIIDKFELYKEYGQETMKETIDELASNIEANDTQEGAYKLVVRASSPQKSVNMLNYLIENLNTTLIKLNGAKSRENRIFLEKRYGEITTKLKQVEDSLVYYQNQTGIFVAEEQAKATLTVYSQMEAELVAKQIEASVMSKLYGDDSPNTISIKLAAQEVKKQIDKLKNGEDGEKLLLSLKNLPEKTMKYLRHYRDVEIYNKMLEFIIHLYEQARLEEQKNIPLLQIIDKPTLPEKKSYPPRVLFALLFTFIIMVLVLAVIIFKEIIDNSKNSKVLFIRKNLLSRSK